MLIAALALVGAIHVFACDEMTCERGMMAGSYTPTSLNLCSLPLCAPLAIGLSMLGPILARLIGQLSASIPIASTVSLPHFVPPPRSA